jgi:hypothetical protein
MMNPETTQPTPDIVPQGLVPNHFELRNERISISFSATSLTGAPLLHFTDGRHDVSARGEEIRAERTEIGTLVTVTLMPDADAGALLFTLLIPRIVLRSRSASQVIDTQGLYTRNRLPPRLPIGAQLQTYEVEELRGTATFVVS